MSLLKGGPADGREIPDRGRQVELIRIENDAVVLDDEGVPLRSPVEPRPRPGRWEAYHRQRWGDAYEHVTGNASRPAWYGGSTRTPRRESPPSA